MLTDSPHQFQRLIVACICLASLFGCAADLQPSLDYANDLLFEENYIEAEQLYRKLLKKIPSPENQSEDEQAQHRLVLDRLGGINSLYLRNYNQAITDYALLVKTYPKTDEAFAARATVADIYHHKLGKLQAALDEFQKLVSYFPNKKRSTWAQFQIVNLYLQLKNYDQARTEAELLLKRWPNAQEARQVQFLVANSYFVQGRYTEAVATYEQLLTIEAEPDFQSLIHFELANCHQSLQNDKRALQHYYNCLANHPSPLLVQRKIRKIRNRLHSKAEESQIHVARRAQKKPATPRKPTPNTSTSEIVAPVHIVEPETITVKMPDSLPETGAPALESTQLQGEKTLEISSPPPQRKPVTHKKNAPQKSPKETTTNSPDEPLPLNPIADEATNLD